MGTTTLGRLSPLCFDAWHGGFHCFRPKHSCITGLVGGVAVVFIYPGIPLNPKPATRFAFSYGQDYLPFVVSDDVVNDRFVAVRSQGF